MQKGRRMQKVYNYKRLKEKKTIRVSTLMPQNILVEALMLDYAFSNQNRSLTSLKIRQSQRVYYKVVL